MKLPFGIFEGKYIHISEINSGRTDVLCPYCEIPLIAKKGRIKRHHFAHDGVGCVAHYAGHFFSLSGRLPIRLPLSVFAKQKLKKINTYFSNLKQEHQEFNQRKAGEDTIIPALKNTLNQLLESDKTGNVKEIMGQIDQYLNQTVAPFPEFHLIRSSTLPPGYTDGKRTSNFAELDKEKHEYFYAEVFEPAVQFLKRYHQKTYDFKEITVKIDLFQKDLAYFNQFDLYFIEVIADHQKFYKIGLTSRVLKTRLKEIEQDLKKYFLNIQLKPLFQIKGFAFLETFFKQKYSTQQMKIGQMTEYFSFAEKEVHLILKDLNLLNFKGAPNRGNEAWIDWVYFNFNGKIYGHKEKSVYVKQDKLVLLPAEFEKLRKLTK